MTAIAAKANLIHNNNEDIVINLSESRGLPANLGALLYRKRNAI